MIIRGIFFFFAMHFYFRQPYPLCIPKNIATFSALLHTREGGRAYGGPPRLSAGNLLFAGMQREEGMRGEVPHNILGVSPLDFGGTRRSQRIAAIVNRGKHRVSSGGPRLRYKIPPRVTRCSPPEETRGVLPSRSAFHSTCPRDDSADNGELLRRQGCVKPRRNATERNLLSFIMRPLQRASGMCGDPAFFILMRTLWRGCKKFCGHK